MNPVYYHGYSEESPLWKVSKVIDTREVTIGLDLDQPLWGKTLNMSAALLLAEELIEDVCGEHAAYRYGPLFVAEVLSHLPADEFKITAADIEDWVQSKEGWEPF